MSSSFLLFDLQSGNVMAEFARESDALDALREAATEDGLEAIEHLSLPFMQNGHPTPIVMEEELVRRVTTDAHLPVQGSHAPDTATSNDLPSKRDSKSRSGKFRSMAS